MVAGLYQLTPLKDMCLLKCRTPISFIMTSWRDGTAGASAWVCSTGLLPRLLLAFLRHSVSARHYEYWGDGRYHSHYIR